MHNKVGWQTREADKKGQNAHLVRTETLPLLKDSFLVAFFHPRKLGSTILALFKPWTGVSLIDIPFSTS
jgi:hypothetical protein